MIDVPSSFAAMPRWWHDGRGGEWLRSLPTLTDRMCRLWGLEVDGAPMHGSNALVVPVIRSGERLALRLAPPDDDVAVQMRALRFWDGRGTVRLIDGSRENGAMLLERLDGRRTLAGEPLEQAMEVLAGIAALLAIPVPEDVAATSSIASTEAGAFERAWDRRGRPTPERVLVAAVRAAQVLAQSPVGRSAVNGDLHFGQVLAGSRAEWLVVDPVLLRGDPEYDLGRILWSRLDEIEDDVEVLALFDRFVAGTAVPRDRAARWVVVRSMSYLLWGLDRGLTLDPRRCRRLLDIFA